MTEPAAPLIRTVIEHPVATVRADLERDLRAASTAVGAVVQCEEPGNVPACVRDVQPHLLLLDLDRDTALALEVARGYRDEDFIIVGIYHPAIVAGRESEMLREAVRAGFADFLTLPLAPSHASDVLTRAAAVGAGRSDGDGRIIAVMGTGGGAGASLFALNAALALAEEGEGRGVALSETSGALSTLPTLMDFEAHHDLVDFATIVESSAPVTSYFAREPNSGLHILPGAADPLRAIQVTSELVSTAILRMGRNFDTVVLDAGSRLDGLSLAALDLAESIALVCASTRPSLVAAAAMVAVLESEGMAARVGVILNASADGGLAARDAVGILGMELAGSLPYDRKAVESVNLGEPAMLVRGRTDYAQSVRALARRLAQGGSA